MPRTGRWDVVVLVALTLCYLVLAWRRRWISDDGLIVTRTVRQLLAGNGPVFNAGERVEANTSTVWTFLLVAAGWVTGADIGWLAVWLGMLLAVLGLVLAVLTARRVQGGTTGAVLPLGALVVLALPPFWDFATSGLETGLVFAWLGGAYWALVTGSGTTSRRRLLLAAVLMGLGPLVRPELAVVGGLFLVALWWLRGRGLRPGLRLVIAAAVLPVGYQVFRMGYYGMLVPQTAIAKEAGSAQWARGLDYATDLLWPYALVVPLVAVAAAGVAPLRRSPGGAGRTTVFVIAPWAASLVLTLYVLRVGGDFMHGRMLLPPLFLVLLPVMVVPRARAWLLLVLPTAAWAVVCAVGLRPAYSETPPWLDEATGIADERRFWTERVGEPNPTTSRPYVDSFGGTAQVRAARPVGVVWPGQDEVLTPREGLPWDFVVVMPIDGIAGSLVDLDEAAMDPLGLTYPLAAHAELGRPGRAGHEKVLPPSYIRADFVDPEGGELPGDPGDEQVDLARRALGCGQIAEMQSAVRDPLTAARFWSNLIGSPGRTSFTIPLDPAEAVETVCGAGASQPVP